MTPFLCIPHWAYYFDLNITLANTSFHKAERKWQPNNNCNGGKHQEKIVCLSPTPPKGVPGTSRELGLDGAWSCLSGVTRPWKRPMTPGQEWPRASPGAEEETRKGLGQPLLPASCTFLPMKNGETVSGLWLLGFMLWLECLRAKLHFFFFFFNDLSPIFRGERFRCGRVPSSYLGPSRKGILISKSHFFLQITYVNCILRFHNPLCH